MHFIKLFLHDFCAAHRLNKGYSGPCKNLHGHNYRVCIKLGTKKLNQFDFVEDFSDVKFLFNQWIRDNLDHGIIVSDIDRSLINFAKKEKQKFYILSGKLNTTVECFSKHLFEQFTHLIHLNKKILNKNLFLAEIEVWETSHSSAVYSI